MLENKNKLFKVLIAVQAMYSLITALWGILDIESFMVVTGQKTDIWLVRTVSALLVPVSVCLLTYLFIETNIIPAVILGLGTAVALAIIDFYYVLKDVIYKVYLADGFAEIVFVIAWIVVAVQLQRSE